MKAKKPKQKKKASKAPKKKAVRVVKKAVPKKTRLLKSAEKLIGRVGHYFDKIRVAALKIQNVLRVGDTVRIEGGGKSFEQRIASMQIDHVKVLTAKKGSEVGFKVQKKVREGYRVFKV